MHTEKERAHTNTHSYTGKDREIVGEIHREIVLIRSVAQTDLKLSM